MARMFINPTITFRQEKSELCVTKYPYQLLVHHGLVIMYAVELVLQNYSWQRVIE